MDNQKIRKKAKQRILARKAFYAHALIYAACVPLLISINMVTSSEFWWWVFPVFGWGFLVAVHFIINYFLVGVHSSESQQKELANEMQRLKESEEMLELESDYLNLEKQEHLREGWDDGEFV